MLSAFQVRSLGPFPSFCELSSKPSLWLTVSLVLVAFLTQFHLTHLFFPLSQLQLPLVHHFPFSFLPDRPPTFLRFPNTLLQGSLHLLMFRPLPFLLVLSIHPLFSFALHLPLLSIYGFFLLLPAISFFPLPLTAIFIVALFLLILAIAFLLTFQFSCHLSRPFFHPFLAFIIGLVILKKVAVPFFLLPLQAALFFLLLVLALLFIPLLIKEQLCLLPFFPLFVVLRFIHRLHYLHCLFFLLL